MVEDMIVHDERRRAWIGDAPSMIDPVAFRSSYLWSRTTFQMASLRSLAFEAILPSFFSGSQA